MLNLLPSLLAVLAPQGPGSSTAPVVINEFSYDDSGTDNLEFVELYNRSAGAVDISGWTVVGYDPGSLIYGGVGNPDPTYVIPAGTILPAGGFYVLGPAIVTNVNQVIGTTNLFENDNETLELRDAANNLVDSVCYEMGRGVIGPHPLEGDGFYGDLAVGDSAGAPLCSISRQIDGLDNNDNGRDFTAVALSTPGASNNQANALPFVDNFDSGSIGAPIPGFAYSFVPPKYTDPTLIDSNNFTVKPPSPQGGLAMLWPDVSGGGNGLQLISAPAADVALECYVWIEPQMTPPDPNPAPVLCSGVTVGTYEPSAGETWAIGVRGSTTGVANPTYVPGDYQAITSPGIGFRPAFNSGIAWMHFRTVQYSRLYLVDLNNGDAPAGGDFTVLAGPIDIVAGQNDGWQRIKIHAQGSRVVANFGGTYGCDDGMRIVRNGVYNNAGAVWLSYREAMCLNNMMRVPLIDALDIHVPTTTQNFIGTGSATTVGTPQIDSDGFALIGTTGYAIEGSGMIPLGAPNYAFCGMVIGFTTVPGGFPLAGAPPTFRGYVAVASSAIGFANAQGQVRFPFLMPCFPQFLGTTLAFQIVDFDPALPFAVPIGATRGMEMRVGR